MEYDYARKMTTILRQGTGEGRQSVPCKAGVLMMQTRPVRFSLSGHTGQHCVIPTEDVARRPF